MSLRYTMMDILDDSTEDIIRDSTTLDISKFKFTNGYYKHVLTQREKERPYKLSSTYYGTVEYENLILLINGVEDVWELPVGTKLQIPRLEDLKTFVQANRI